MADFILTTTGQLISLVNIKKVFTNGVSLIFEHNDGTNTTVNYVNAATAASALSNISSSIVPINAGAPEISSVAPFSIAVGTLPQSVVIKGSGFDASALIFLTSSTGYPDTSALVPSLITSTQITVTIPNTVAVNSYDVLYIDTPGNTFKKSSALIIY